MEASGEVVFFGKEKDEDPAAFHVFNFQKVWRETRKAPCSHDILRLLCVTVGDSESILVSCSHCCIIWFFDIRSGIFKKAFEQSNFYPGLMCKADGDNIFIARSVSDHWPVHKAKVGETEIVLDNSKTINTEIMQFNFMCYLPNVQRVAVSKWSDHIVKAISCDPPVVAGWVIIGGSRGGGAGTRAPPSGSNFLHFHAVFGKNWSNSMLAPPPLWGWRPPVWEILDPPLVMKGEWEPHGLLYVPEQQLLLVCDEGRIVVADPTDESFHQIISLPDSSTVLPISLHMYNGNIIVHTKTVTGEKVTIYAIE